MSAQHTGGPWNASRAKMPDNTGGYDWCITDGSGKIIGEAFEHVDYGQRGSYDIRPAEANAAFIVLACNSHGELVSALEGSAVALEEASKLLFAKGLQGCASIMMGHRDIALAAISKAKGEAL